LILAADATNVDNIREGGQGEGEEPRFHCLHCGLTLLLPEEQCPRCHKVGRRIVQIVNERMIIRDRTVRVLAAIERRYWFLI
jgi:hypothetical protein